MSDSNFNKTPSAFERSCDKRPLVSIVIPSYNRAHMLPGAIRSILDQTYQNLEIIIVNDGSTDNTYNAIEELVAGNSRIKAYHKQNEGIADTLNYGFRRTNGKYVTWNSDDNYYHKTAIERMATYLDLNADVDFVYTDARKIDTDGREIGLFRAGPPVSVLDGCMTCGCLLYRREVNDIVGPYNPEWKIAQDYDFYLRAYHKIRMAHIPDVLYDYTVHEASMSGMHVKSVYEFGKVREKFSKTRKERRKVWANCYTNIAHYRMNQGRKWSAVYFYLLATKCERGHYYILWDVFWRVVYGSLPEYIKNIWRLLKKKFTLYHYKRR